MQSIALVWLHTDVCFAWLVIIQGEFLGWKLTDVVLHWMVLTNEKKYLVPNSTKHSFIGAHQVSFDHMFSNQ
jgi:hypothetical protein